MKRDLSSPKHQLLFQSPAMRACVEEASLLAKTDFPMLLVGETGVGKECFAHLLHVESRRANKPFVAINGAALSPSLAASELFGHEKGSFTGAHQARRGAFEAAHGGTLFIDEITEMPLEIQTILLRVLQEHEFFRVGGTRTIASDVRLITATNRDVKEAIREGKLRKDLYYRIKGGLIEIPPLRDRLEDLSLMAALFAKQAAEEYKTPEPFFTRSAVEALLGHDWEGNVRELKNAVQTAVVKASNGARGIVSMKHLPGDVRRPSFVLWRPCSFKEEALRLLGTFSPWEGRAAIMPAIEAVEAGEEADLILQETPQVQDLPEALPLRPAERGEGLPPTDQPRRLAPEEVVDIQKDPLLFFLHKKLESLPLSMEERRESFNRLYDAFFPDNRTKLVRKALRIAQRYQKQEEPIPTFSTMLTTLNGRRKISSSVLRTLRLYLEHGSKAGQGQLERFDKAIDVFNRIASGRAREPLPHSAAPSP